MGELSIIVDKLNSAPFHLNYSLVTFDELTPFDLVLLLQKVLEHLDTSHTAADPRQDTLQQTKKRICDFLSMLKFNFPSNAIEADRFKEELVGGERRAVYPVLYYLLSKLNWCKTRAYVARFLSRVEVPAELYYHEAVKEQLDKYELLKKTFSDAHKKVEKLRREKLAPQELFDQIAQLQEEKAQLNDKISSLQKRTHDMGPAFQHIFAATSDLRQAREEQSKLQKTGYKQRSALQEVRMRHDALRKTLEITRKTHSDAASAEEMLDALKQQVKEKRREMTAELPREISVARRKMREAEEEAARPAKTAEDVDELQEVVDAAQAEVESLRSEISRLQRMGGEKDGLKMFQRQAAMWRKKLEQEEQELEKVVQEVATVRNSIADIEAQKEISLGQQNMRMRPEDFNSYAINLRDKTAEHKRKKKEIAAIRAESVVLSRTEAILRGRTADLDVLLRKIEEEGVKRSSSQRSVSSAPEDNHKGKSLEELSRLIHRFDEKLSEKKRAVAPLVEQRRKLLPEKEELQKAHREKKQIYDSIAVGLESERIQLERDCDMYQEEALRQESKYHLLHCKGLLTEVSLEKVREEEDFERSNGKLLRDFQCYKDLYQQKIQQQEQMSKELRKQQRELKECEGSNSEQRKIFEDLRRLLYVKLQVQQNQQQPNSMNDGVIDLGQDVGGANVMTIAQN